MRTWVDFDTTAYHILLHLGYRYFVFDGRDEKQCLLYPYKQKASAVKYTLDNYKGELKINCYIMTDEEPLRELARGIDLLSVKVLI